MNTLWLHNGVAYHSRDLAILHGAENPERIKFNDTLDDDIELELYSDRLVVTECYDQIEIPTENLDDLDYFGIDFQMRELSKDMRGRIEGKIVYFVEDIRYGDGNEDF